MPQGQDRDTRESLGSEHSAAILAATADAALAAIVLSRKPDFPPGGGRPTKTQSGGDNSAEGARRHEKINYLTQRRHGAKNRKEGLLYFLAALPLRPLARAVLFLRAYP